MYLWLRLTGSGKSTLVSFIISALNLRQEDVFYIAYTGKAAQVLRRKGCHGAMTAHRLLYKSIQKKDGTYIHIPKMELPPCKLIIVDEVSMLPKIMWDLLLTHKIPVIALGDPGQLPPVAAIANDVLDSPHVFLDEIMRQAAESEIIRLTMDIREGKPLTCMRGEEVRVVNRDELLNPNFLLWADQILCGKNCTRNQVNSVMREALMKTQDAEPLIGDRLICLRNDWDCINATGDALVNGMGCLLTDIHYTSTNPFMKKTPIITVQPDFEDSGIFADLEADYKIFTEHAPTVDKETFRKIPKCFRPKEFDYGYAITCHKAQGSEYEKVIVLEEFLKSDNKESHIKWLYTACTRSSSKLIVVKNY